MKRRHRARARRGGYTLEDFGRAAGWSSREVEAYRKQAAWTAATLRLLRKEPA